MPTRYIEPFDFQKLINYFIGNNILFAFFFLIIYSFSAAYFGFSNKLYYFILVIGVVLFGVFIGVDMYILALILIGGFIFREVAKLVV